MSDRPLVSLKLAGPEGWYCPECEVFSTDKDELTTQGLENLCNQCDSAYVIKVKLLEMDEKTEEVSILASHVTGPRPLLRRILAWALQHKDAEVRHRPDENMWKRVLTQTWDQFIKYVQLLLDEEE